MTSGKKHKIKVKVHNILDSMTNFKCQYSVEYEQKTHEKLGVRNGDEIM